MPSECRVLTSVYDMLFVNELDKKLSYIDQLNI